MRKQKRPVSSFNFRVAMGSAMGSGLRMLLIINKFVRPDPIQPEKNIEKMGKI